MQLDHIAKLQGHRPIFSCRKFILTVHRNQICRWSDLNNKVERICNIPNSISDYFTQNHRLTRRIFRHGVRCSIRINEKEFLISTSQGIYRFDIISGDIRLEMSLNGLFRPLGFTSIFNISGFQDGIYFGDYGQNPGRGPMDIHFRTPSGDWKSIFRFGTQEIDHIHSIIPDPIRDCVWVLTGDLDRASSIWLAKDGFSDIKSVFRGEQIARSCVAFPLKKGLLYATDSHIEQNSIRILEPKEDRWVSSLVREIPGSCIYGSRLGDSFFFSTAHEPGPASGNLLLDLFDRKRGPGINGDFCEIIAGNIDLGFQTILHRPVDIYPKRLFQFSTFIFPSAENDAELLVIYNMGIKHYDDSTEIFRLV